MSTWEPWRPRVGDLVRVRVSPECPRRHECHNPSLTAPEHKLLWHMTAPQEAKRALLNGHVGVVQSDECANPPCGQDGDPLSLEECPPCLRVEDCDLYASGHVYYVSDAGTDGREMVLGDYFAAIELTPVGVEP